MHSWAFAQLGAFLSYKARPPGIAFIEVDPAYSSQTLLRVQGESTKEIASLKESLSVASVASLGMPTTMQLSLPSAVSSAGVESCAHTQRLGKQQARTARTGHKPVPVRKGSMGVACRYPCRSKWLLEGNTIHDSGKGIERIRTVVPAWRYRLWPAASHAFPPSLGRSAMN